MPETKPEQATQESNAEVEQVVETASQEAAASEETQDGKPEAQTATATEKADEPVFEIDGEKLTASEIRQLKKDRENDSKWKDENRRKAEELNRRAKELGPLELLKPYLEQRPEVLQQLFAPKQERNLQAELSALDAKKPDPYQDFNGYETWREQRQEIKDAIREREVLKHAEQRYMSSLAEQHNLSLEKEAKARYVDSEKVSAEDFRGPMTQWIVQTLKPDANGRYPAESYDLAYKVLYGDKEMRAGKLEATQRMITQLDKAKPADTVHGARKAEVPKTEKELEDEAFVEEARRFAPKK